jgi:hypothetical protein
MGGARGQLDGGVVQAASHVDVLARRRRQQEGILRHQADLGAEARVVDAGQRLAEQLDAAAVAVAVEGVVAQQQRQQGRLAAAGVADDAEEGALRDVERQLVQHGLAGHIGEVQAAHPHRRHARGHGLTGGVGDARTGMLGRAGFVEQGGHARGGDHRLLQAAELHRDLDQRLDHPRDIADEGVQHPDLDRVHAALAEAEDHHAPAAAR